MTLGQKLILYALAIALLPLSVTGFVLIKSSEDAMRQRIQGHQQTAAAAVSAKVSQAVEHLARTLATALEMVDLGQLTEHERAGLVRMLYRQSPHIAVAILHRSDGSPLAPPAFLAEEHVQPSSRHMPATTADAERLASLIPSFLRLAGGELAGASAVWMGPVYYPYAGDARVAFALPCDFDETGSPRALAAVELALSRDALRSEGLDVAGDAVVFIADAEGRLISHPDETPGTNFSAHQAVATFLASHRVGALRYIGADEHFWVGAYAPVGALGWGAFVEQPEREAFAAVWAMRRQILLWMLGTVLIVVGSGLAFAARLRKWLARMVEGARRFGAGDLEHRVLVPSQDELGELSTTMNQMAAELSASLQELEKWNRTLEAKVEERTRELRETQAELAIHSKLAAIGQLGAGVAHEVNNPLAGILGYAQMLLRKLEANDLRRTHVEKIEEAAKRCKAVTQRLLRFSERGFDGPSSFSVNELVEEVLSFMTPGMTDAGIQVQVELDPTVPAIVGDGGQISLVLVNVLGNARNAMSDGGVATVSTTPCQRDGALWGVRIVVSDTGHGIKKEHLSRLFDPFFTTKNAWSGAGLGLSVAYRIVQDHGGRIFVESQPGQGARVTVELPLEGALTNDVERVGRDQVLLA